MIKRALVFLGTAIVVLSVSCGPVAPATSTSEETSKQIASLKQELQAKEGEINNLQGQLKERDNEIAALRHFVSQ